MIEEQALLQKKQKNLVHGQAIVNQYLEQKQREELNKQEELREIIKNQPIYDQLFFENEQNIYSKIVNDRKKNVEENMDSCLEGKQFQQDCKQQRLDNYEDKSKKFYQRKQKLQQILDEQEKLKKKNLMYENQKILKSQMKSNNKKKEEERVMHWDQKNLWEKQNNLDIAKENFEKQKRNQMVSKFQKELDQQLKEDLYTKQLLNQKKQKFGEEEAKINSKLFGEIQKIKEAAEQQIKD